MQGEARAVFLVLRSVEDHGPYFVYPTPSPISCLKPGILVFCLMAYNIRASSFPLVRAVFYDC